MQDRYRHLTQHTCYAGVALLLALSLGVGSTGADGVDAKTTDARAIMKAVYDRPAGTRTIGRMTLQTRDGAGTRAHVLVTRSGRIDGADRNLSIVAEPADERNTAFLSVDYRNTREGEQWIYLPKLRRTMRIPAKGRSEAFLGSDFSYSDLRRQDPDAFELKLVEASVSVDGDTCWRIEAKPRSARGLDESGYQRLELWVSQSKLLPLQIKSWLAREEGKTKYIKVSDIRQVDGIWTPHLLQAKTLTNGKVSSETTLSVSGVRYGAAEVSDGDLTLQRLERGL